MTNQELQQEIKRQAERTSTNNSGGSGGGYGFGGYRPSEKVTGALDNIANGSYMNNPYAQNSPKMTWDDWRKTNGNVREEYDAYANDYDENIRNAEAWDTDMANYKGSEGLKYLADQGFSDEDMQYIWGQMYNDPRFRDIVMNNTDANGEIVPLEEAFQRFMYGDENGGGGYYKPEEGEEPPRDTNGLAETEVKNIENVSGKSWDDMNDDEKIYWYSKTGYADMVRNYAGMYEAARSDPSSPYHDIATKINNRQEFINAMVARDPKASDFKEAVESYEKSNPDMGDTLMSAFEDALEQSELRDYETRRQTGNLTNEDLTRQALEAGGSLDAIVYNQEAMPEYRPPEPNPSKENSAGQNYDTLDFSSNPFPSRGNSRGDSLIYDQAVMRAVTEGINPDSPEYASRVKEIFLDIKNSGYRNYY